MDPFKQFEKMAVMPKIAILTPTRNRPGKLLDCLGGVAATTACPTTKIYIGVDEDDPSRDEIIGIVEQFGCAVRVDIPACKEFPGLGWLWNRVAEKAMADGMDILCMQGDDTICKTKGWDLMVANAYISGPEDGILCAYIDEGNDALKKNTSCPCVSMKYVELIGRYVPEYYMVDGIDTHLSDVHERIGRLKIVHGVLWDHIHWRKGRCDPDDTTLNRMSWHKNKEETLRTWGASENLRKEEASRLQSYIDEFKRGM